MSEPAEISRSIGFKLDSFSFVITTGGLGLFFEPGGLPLGFFGTEQEPILSMSLLVVCFLDFEEENVLLVFLLLGSVVGVLWGLCSEFSSEEVGEMSRPT